MPYKILHTFPLKQAVSPTLFSTIPAAGLLLLTGCTFVAPVVEPEEIGLATSCYWYAHRPIVCTLDRTRGTINLEYLQSLLDRIETSRSEAFDRRAL